MERGDYAEQNEQSGWGDARRGHALFFDVNLTVSGLAPPQTVHVVCHHRFTFTSIYKIDVLFAHNIMPLFRLEYHISGFIANSDVLRDSCHHQLFPSLR